MNRVVEWTHPGRGRGASGTAGGSGGGSVDDILERLGTVESSVNDVQAKVSAISAVLPHLATRAELHSLEASLIRWIVGTAIASVAVCSALVSVVVKFVG